MNSGSAKSEINQIEILISHNVIVEEKPIIRNVEEKTIDEIKPIIGKGKEKPILKIPTIGKTKIKGIISKANNMAQERHSKKLTWSQIVSMKS